ncbi:uncharacterized protein LOC122668420 [Telopea speciosissima]|uniref:uncharacterized protein LOC122668420 n=1 Tax=Telopea speciosissima TaxID=54955 RepID=UPI001CC506C1|nr:uncharacterized protein LOC122668420 [Telopea speciosissima]
MEKTAFAAFLRRRLLKKDGTPKSAVGSSTVLLGLCRVCEFVQSAERWVVGNGSSIRLWYDTWVGDHSVEELLKPNWIPSNLTATVSEFLEGDQWDFPAAASSTIQAAFERIKALGIKATTREDLWKWAHCKTGSFTVKSA